MPEELRCTRKRDIDCNTERPQTILLVEDEECVRQVAREILELEGYLVISTANPHQALEQFERHDGAVDLLLTDVVMPGMDGYDLAQKLAHMQPSIRVIFMSGYTENRLLRRGICNLHTAYLQKPFTLQALVDKVRQVLAGPEPWNLHAPVDEVNGASL